MVWATPYLKNEFGDPRFFFNVFIESYHFLPSVKVLKKSVCGKLLGANVLKKANAFNWDADGDAGMAHAVVRALVSHQCGPGSIPGPGIICGLSLLLVLVRASRVFLWVLQFSSLHKNQHSKFQFHPEMRATGLSALLLSPSLKKTEDILKTELITWWSCDFPDRWLSRF